MFPSYPRGTGSVHTLYRSLTEQTEELNWCFTSSAPGKNTNWSHNTETTTAKIHVIVSWFITWWSLVSGYQHTTSIWTWTRIRMKYVPPKRWYPPTNRRVITHNTIHWVRLETNALIKTWGIRTKYVDSFRGLSDNASCVEIIFSRMAG